jgi:hypothetical protein
LGCFTKLIDHTDLTRQFSARLSQSGFKGRSLQHGSIKYSGLSLTQKVPRLCSEGLSTRRIQGKIRIFWLEQQREQGLVQYQGLQGLQA